MNDFDVIIIGAGVIGCACARELSRFDLKIAVIEKCSDVCEGTSKANSAIIHSGIDCKTGTLMQKMNVLGNSMMDSLSEELDFEFKRNGSLILMFDEDDRDKLNSLYEQGVANGVPDLRIVEKEELKELEPNVSDEVKAAIYAPSGGIVCPFGMTIAYAENAFANGVSFFLNTEVKDIKYEDKNTRIYTVGTDNKTFTASCIVNAAGVYADVFHNMVSSNKIHITPRKGEYCLFDKSCGSHVSKTIFQLPGKYGKGVLVTPTVHGNLLTGPTATDLDDREDISTTKEGIDYLLSKASKSVNNLPLKKVITSFAGLRAHEDGHEFIIEEISDSKGFIDVAGIESPGLSSAPAIAVRVSDIVKSILNPADNKTFDGKRKGILNPRNLSGKEYAELISKKPEYGNIVCRCELVTEGEIIDSIKRPLGATTLDGVKRRTRAGMGRCQAGFCTPKTMEILSRELGIEQTEILKNQKGSNLVTGISKGGH